MRTGLQGISGSKGSKELGHRRRAALRLDLAGVEARHRFIADDVGLVGAEAVELRPHRTAIGAEHADLDEVAGLDVRRQIEDRKSVVEGKSVSVRVDPGGPRVIKKKKQI